MSLVSRRSTLCSGNPTSALRGMVSPEAIVALPSNRLATSMTSPFASVAVAGMTIALVAPPAAVRFRRLVPGFPYGAPAIAAANR